MTDTSLDEALLELGAASIETKGTVFGTGEIMGKYQPAGLTDQ